MNRATFTEAELLFLARMRVARLATADASGQPYVIPIVFATDGQRLYTPVDEKPKRVAPSQLKRVRNLLVNPRVAVVVDEYDEDWTQLAWMLVTGRAEIVEAGETHTAGIGLLQAKYPQYGMMPLEHRLLIVVAPARVTSWGRLTVTEWHNHV
jgi:PPOX class probable F420-dependent enzyme